jgi:pimeloyl-ACP methyl ester carboxylesterase
MTQTNPPEKTKRALWKRILIWAGIAILAIIAFVLIIGIFPMSTDGFDADPHPVANYDQAVAMVEKIQEEEAPITKEISRSILMTHGEKTEDVYVLVHGVTNAPHEFEELGKMLYDQGANVIILRMPHHGLTSGDISELKALKPEEILDYMNTTVDIADALGDNMTVIGPSAGATAAAWMAQTREEVDRAVLLSPFMGIKETPMFLDPLLMRAFLRLPGFSIGGGDEPDRDWVYVGESSKGIGTFMLIGQATLKQAETTPPKADEIYIITTASDLGADNRWAMKLADLWTAQGADVTTYEFPKSEHVPHASIDPFTDQPIRQKVYDKISEWLASHPIQ